MIELRSVAVTSFLICCTLVVAGFSLTVSTADVSASDDKAVIALENKAWEQWKKADKAGYSELLAEPAIKVSGLGIVTGKASFLAADLPAGCEKRDFALDSHTVHKITDDVQIVTYVAHVTQTCNDDPDDHTLFVSSVWAKKNGAWKNVMLTEANAAN